MSSDQIDATIEGARPAGEARHGVLIVDDEPAILESLELTLGEDYRVFTAQSGEEGLAVLEKEDVSLIISDQVLPSMSGVEFLERAIELNPRAIRMMITGYADIGSLARAVNEGRIYRYIAKPWEPDEVRLNVKRALEAQELATENVQLAAALADANQRLRAENLFLRREVERKYAFDQIIGASTAMNQVFEVMEKVAETDATVLITGETGTGKELVARAIHYCGPRKGKRFVAQNCAARHAARERALRSRARRLHGRPCRQEGPLRGGAPRHRLSRRGGRDAPRHAGAIAARAPGR